MLRALLVQAVALFYMTGWNTNISYGDAATGRLISAAGLPFLFIPISTQAYAGLRPDQTNQASSLLNVARNLGGSFGISLAQAGLIERAQYHQDRLGEGLNPLNPEYVRGLDQITSSIGSGPDTDASALGQIYAQVTQQAQMLSYIDVFHALMIFVLIITPFGLLLRKPQAGAAGAG